MLGADEIRRFERARGWAVTIEERVAMGLRGGIGWLLVACVCVCVCVCPGSDSSGRLGAVTCNEAADGAEGRWVRWVRKNTSEQ